MQLRISEESDLDRRAVERAVRLQLARFATVIERIGLAFGGKTDDPTHQICRVRAQLRDGSNLEFVARAATPQDAAREAASRLRRRLDRARP